ncbi:phosphotransferase [Stagonosporopsis vannaccii]|nr:phosphotransferase [Stagonosporopsis vannaccii]
MPATSSPKEVASALLAKQGLSVVSISILQSLWAGYGQICRISAVDASEKTRSLILKLITPPPTRAGDEGHTRKILSYQVEQYFYRHLAPQLPASVPVAKCLASVSQHHPDGTSTTAMILNDLKQDFPVAGEKRGALSPIQVDAALDWLAGFHGFWWSRLSEMDSTKLVLPPLEEVKQDGQDAIEKTVWLNGGCESTLKPKVARLVSGEIVLTKGTDTYLATRRSEYYNLANDDSEWTEPLTGSLNGHDQSIAELVAAFLAPSASGQSPIEGYQTLIHGDVKSENLFTSKSGEQVAFYDFQYTGFGLGVCDLAKLFTCSVPLDMLVLDEDVPHRLDMQEGEKRLLWRYWNKLQATSGKEYKWEVFVQHWEIALVDWLRFQASWGFWGNTEWLEARVRSILKNEQLRDVLKKMSAGR